MPGIDGAVQNQSQGQASAPEDPSGNLLSRLISGPASDSIQVGGQSFPLKTGVGPAVSRFPAGRMKSLAENLRGIRKFSSGANNAIWTAFLVRAAQDPEVQQIVGEAFAPMIETDRKMIEGLLNLLDSGPEEIIIPNEDSDGGS